MRWIDFQPPTYALEDERSAQIVAGNLNATAPPATLPVTGYVAQLTNLGIDGTGVVIAINDTGVDTNTTAAVQADLAGRIAFGAATPGIGDTDGHGTTQNQPCDRVRIARRTGERPTGCQRGIGGRTRRSGSHPDASAFDCR